MLKRLNKFFNSNIDIDFNNIFLDDFNNYLKEYVKTRDILYTNKICVINNNKIYYFNNKFFEIEHNNNRKLLNKINKTFEIKIVDVNIALDNKISYKIIKNYLFGNDVHYINKELPFSNLDYRVFLTEWFYNYCTKNKKFIEFLKFCTNMLFSIENGIILENYNYSPIVNVVNNGRWYFNSNNNLDNVGNIHNNLDNRNKFIEILKNNGYILNLDLISAVPNMFYKTTKSKQIYILNECRLNNLNNKELKDSIKDLTNIYIFSNYDFDTLKKYYDDKIDFSLIKSKLNITSLHDFFNKLQEEIKIYDQNIINKYKNNLNNKELNRNICLPEIFNSTKKDFIKKHRTYINGHVNDIILMMAYKVFQKVNIYPIYTIYDNLMYFSKNKDIIDKVNDVLTKIKIHAKIYFN